MADSLEQIKQSIESTTFLSGVEKELLLDILPNWPKERLPDLLSTVQGGGGAKPRVQAAPVTTPRRSEPAVHSQTRPPLATQATPTPLPDHPANLNSLLKRLQSETVDLRQRLEHVERHASKPIAAVSPAVPVASITPKPKPIAPQPIKPAVRSQVPAKVQAPVQKKSVAFAGKSINQIKSSEDLKEVTLAALRQGNFTENLALLKSKIIEIAGQEQTLPYIMAKKFEESKVNRLFIQMGLTLMDDISKDRSNSFVRAGTLLESQYGESFTVEEFEAFSDFKDQLESLLYS